MSWIDWTIMAVPMIVVCFIAYTTHKYMKGVSDFLSAGRVAGRYLVCTATGMAGMGVGSVLGAFEHRTVAGFSALWWQMLGFPVGVIMSLTGFVIYRYRETRALTLAQFFEMRYSRRFRIFAGMLAAGSGILNYGILPAIGGRFFVYFCGLPENIHLAGLTIPTFAIVMAVFLGTSLFFVITGGQLTIMVTDCVQGLFSYAMYLVVALTLLYLFSWHQITVALMSFPKDQSLINPFKSFQIHDFNIWFDLIGIFGGVYTVMAWQGAAGFNASAASPHEQKMGGILGNWRALVFEVMQTLLAICALTFLVNHDFSKGAEAAKQILSQVHGANSLERDYLQTQMRIPIALATFLPIGIKGIFAALMFFLACTNDVSYLHSWGSIVAQDVIMPFRDKPFSPKAHILLLRLCVTGVTIFGFCWSLFYHQVGYIRMYLSVTGVIFLGGAGSVIIGGLYWKKGTTAAAWTAMVSGGLVAVIGIYLDHYWIDLQPHLLNYFPQSEYLAQHAIKFPVNDQYISLISMCTAIALYIIISLLTCRTDFNLARMLHRGPYAVDANGDPAPLPPGPPRTFRALLGIDEHFTRGDKILATSMFCYFMGWFLVFVVISIWNVIHIWPDERWAAYWFYAVIVLPIVLGTVTSIWFTIGGIRDLRRLFQRLRVLQRDIQDDGTVKHNGDPPTGPVAHPRNSRRQDLLEYDLKAQNEERELPVKRALILICLLAGMSAIQNASAEPTAAPIVVPLFTQAPVIDGKIDPAEWRQAVRIDGLTTSEKKLERRQVHCWIGATEDTLYVAMQSRLPDEGPLLGVVDHDGLKVVYDDALEVFVDPAPNQIDRVMYQILANSIGHNGYQAQTLGKAAEEATWQGNWHQAQSQANGFWNFECAIPISSLTQAGSGRKATDGLWMINLCRDWRPDWTWSSFTGKYVWSGLVFRFTQSPNPIVHEIIDGDPTYPRGGGSGVRLLLKNPSSDSISCKASLHLVRNNMPEVNQDQISTLAPGEEKTVSISLDANDPTTIFDLTANVMGGDGQQTLFNRTLHWEKAAAPIRWVTRKPANAALVDLQFAYYPSKNHMRVLADISALPAKTPANRVVAIVRDRLTHAEIKVVSFPIEQFKNGKQEIAFDLPPLNGLYEIAVQAAGENMKTAEAVKYFERKVFPWEDLPVGRSRIVYAPFTPIEVQGRQLSTVLRKHDLNDFGLLDQIATTNANTNITKDLLAAPMHYRAIADGKEIDCTADPMQTVETAGDEAKFRGHFSAGSLSVNWEDQWDYDGTVRVALTLQPTNGQTVQGLTLEIPLRAEIATLLHANSDRIRSPIAEIIPPETGIVWDGSKVACDDFIRNFCPYIYLGDGNRGLCWFADNDRNWGWDPATPNLDVVRQGNQVVLRIHLINKPTIIAAPRTLVFGLLAAPIKPRLNPTADSNWWRYRFNRDSYRLLGTDINWFGNYSCGAVYPVGKDMYLWEMLARGSREKLSDAEISAFAKYGEKYFVDYGEDKVKIWNQHVQRNLRRHLNGRMIFYFNRASCSELEEFETFKDEWCLDDYRANDKSTARDEIKVVPSESYINYNLYWNARSFEVGNNKGVYWDNWFIAPSFNTEMTDAYRAPDGRIVPAAGIWAMREQAKRTFQMMNEKGVLPVIFPHVTSFSCLPMLSFATVQYEWEWKYSQSDVQDRFRREYIRLVTTGEQAGTWPVPLHDQLALADDLWTQRTFAAVRLVHELDGYGGFATTDKLLKPVFAIIDKPGTIAYRYWDDRPMPAHCANADIPLLVYSNPGNEALIIASSYESADADAQIEVDWQALGLSASSTATDAETGSPLTVRDDKIIFPLKRHDLKLIHLSK